MTLIVSIAMTSYDGVKDQGRSDITKYELTQIRTALIQFRQDSGTKSFPAQGSYDCTDEVNGGVVTEVNSLFFFPTDVTGTNAELIAWCEHPANLWMLFQDPFGRADIDQWNPDTKRGWNGPYLQRKEGYLTLNSNTINLNDSALPLWAITDPYVVNQLSTGVQWSIQTTSDVLEQAGAPYLLLVDITNSPTVFEPRIISASDDGFFEPYNDSGINVVDNDCINSQELDQVLCLLN